MKTVMQIVLASIVLLGTAYAGGPGTDGGCRWPTNPNGPCVLDELPSQPT